MFGKNKKQDGQALIASTLATFEKAAEDLQEGINLCDAEEARIDAEIDELNMTKAANNTARNKGVAVRKNILKLLA